MQTARKKPCQNFLVFLTRFFRTNRERSERHAPHQHHAEAVSRHCAGGSARLFSHHTAGRALISGTLAANQIRAGPLGDRAGPDSRPAHIGEHGFAILSEADCKKEQKRSQAAARLWRPHIGAAPHNCVCKPCQIMRCCLNILLLIPKGECK